VSTISKKTLRIILLSSLGAAALLTVAYAAMNIGSNTVHVDVDYQVALSYTVTGATVNLDAVVSNGASPDVGGIVVEFYYSYYGSTLTLFDTQTTDASGLAQSTYSITANGSYDFQAIAIIP